MRELQEYPGALASLRWQRGQQYGAVGEYDLAIRDFDESLRLAEIKAVARFYGQAWVYNQRGQTFGMKGDYDRAIADFTEALRREPKFAAALFNRGQTYRAKGALAAAVADFSAAIVLDPEYVAAYRMRGAVYHAMRNYDAAIDDFAKALTLVPDYAAAWGGRGIAYLAKGNYELASADFDLAMQINPADPEVARSRDVAASIQVCVRPRASADTRSKACSLLIGDRSLPADLRATAYRERASAALQSAARQADFDGVLSDLSEAVQLAPHSAAAAYRLRSGVYARLGDADRALDEISRAIELDRNSLAAYVGRSLIHAAEGDGDRAIADIDAAMRLEPRRAALYVLRGDAWFAKGDTPRARADFEKAVELDPDNSRGAGALAWSRRADVQFSMGNVDAAIANYGEAIRLAPRDAEFFAGRAILFRVRGQLAEAAQDFDRALAINPNALSAYAGRAIVRFSRHDFANAASDFARLTRQAPNVNAGLWLHLSRVRAGQPDSGDELARALAVVRSPAWPAPVAELFLGKRTPASVIGAATNAQERCEAQFFAGEWQLAKGARTEATKALAVAERECPVHSAERSIAADNLKELSQ